MTSLIQLNFIFYSEEPVTLAYSYVFCFALFYCLDCNVNCIRDFGIILYKVFLIFFKIVSSGFSHNKHREVVDELSFPKSVLHASHYCQICQLNIVPLCYVAGKQALFKAPVVKKNGFYLH